MITIIIIIIIIIIQFADHKNELNSKNEGTSPNSQSSTRFRQTKLLFLSE